MSVRRVSSFAAVLAFAACSAPPVAVDPGWFGRLGDSHGFAVPVRLPSAWRRELPAHALHAAPRAGDALLYLASLDDGDLLQRFVEVSVLACDERSGSTRVRLAVFADGGEALGATEHALPTVHLTNGLHSAAEQLFAGTARLEPEELNPVLAGVHSLQTLLSVIEDDPHLSPLLWRVVVAPSIWSVIAHFGVDASITLSTAVRAGDGARDPIGSALRTPLELDLNGAPALRCSIVSVAPRAPYSAGAGIVALVAERPDGSALRFALELIAARSVSSTRDRETVDATRDGPGPGQAQAAGPQSLRSP